MGVKVFYVLVVMISRVCPRCCWWFAVLFWIVFYHIVCLSVFLVVARNSSKPRRAKWLLRTVLGTVKEQDRRGSRRQCKLLMAALMRPWAFPLAWWFHFIQYSYESLRRMVHWGRIVDKSPTPPCSLPFLAWILMKSDF